VLRQKEKYLYQDDSSRSPIKRSKSKIPDIERALSNWARNHQRQGLSLSDAAIREKARFFAQTVGNSESHLKVNSTSWLEKFKQKNHLMGARARKSSIAEESEGTSNPPSNVHTPGAISPTSPGGVSPATTIMTAKKSQENLKTENPDTYDFSNHRRPFHSQSSTSLSSVFTDTATSPTSLSPTQIPNSMQPPPLPSTGQYDDKGSSADSSPITPSQEEAARALELVMNFFQSQNPGFVVEPQEYVTIGKLMEKLRIKRSSESVPSDMLPFSEPAQDGRR
jgi:hypothetical protein